MLPLLREFARVPGNETGGHLSTILRDGNVSDEQVALCLERAEAAGDALGVDMARTLLARTRTQRRQLAGMFYVLHIAALGCGDGFHVAPTGESCSCGEAGNQRTSADAT